MGRIWPKINSRDSGALVWEKKWQNYSWKIVPRGKSPRKFLKGCPLKNDGLQGGKITWGMGYVLYKNWKFRQLTYWTFENKLWSESFFNELVFIYFIFCLRGLSDFVCCDCWFYTSHCIGLRCVRWQAQSLIYWNSATNWCFQDIAFIDTDCPIPL